MPLFERTGNSNNANKSGSSPSKSRSKSNSSSGSEQTIHSYEHYRKLCKQQEEQITQLIKTLNSINQDHENLLKKYESLVAEHDIQTQKYNQLLQQNNNNNNNESNNDNNNTNNQSEISNVNNISNINNSNPIGKPPQVPIKKNNLNTNKTRFSLGSGLQSLFRRAKTGHKPISSNTPQNEELSISKGNELSIVSADIDNTNKLNISNNLNNEEKPSSENNVIHDHDNLTDHYHTPSINKSQSVGFVGRSRSQSQSNPYSLNMHPRSASASASPSHSNSHSERSRTRSMNFSHSADQDIQNIKNINNESHLKHNICDNINDIAIDNVVNQITFQESIITDNQAKEIELNKKKYINK